jgi:hypothetical protein
MKSAHDSKLNQPDLLVGVELLRSGCDRRVGLERDLTLLTELVGVHQYKLKLAKSLE